LIIPHLGFAIVFVLAKLSAIASALSSTVRIVMHVPGLPLKLKEPHAPNHGFRAVFSSSEMICMARIFWCVACCSSG
jgi:hypothetical protein